MNALVEMDDELTEPKAAQMHYHVEISFRDGTHAVLDEHYPVTEFVAYLLERPEITRVEVTKNAPGA